MICLLALLGDRVDQHAAVGGLAHGASDHDLLLGHAHAAKLDREALEMLGAAGRLGLRARDLGHRPEAVQDAPGQADGARELLVDVDRVEVARGAGVAGGEVLVGRDPHLGDPALRRCRSAISAHTPRTMSVQVPRQTCSPRWLVETDSKT